MCYTFCKCGLVDRPVEENLIGFLFELGDLYARAVLDEMDDAFERDTFGPIMG